MDAVDDLDRATEALGDALLDLKEGKIKSAKAREILENAKKIAKQTPQHLTYEEGGTRFQGTLQEGTGLLQTGIRQMERALEARRVPPESQMTYYTGHHSPQVLEAATRRGDIGLVITPDKAEYVRHINDYGKVIVDNGAFQQGGFKPKDFTRLLDRLDQQPGAKGKVEFVVAPDVVGKAQDTLDLFKEWGPKIRDRGFKVALVAQNGLEDIPERIPWDKFDTLFVGGSTEWKMGGPEGAVANDPRMKRWSKLFDAAAAHGKQVHFGRVNSANRLDFASWMGANSADGTFTLFSPETNVPRLEKFLDNVNIADVDERTPEPPQSKTTAGSEKPSGSASPSLSDRLQSVADAATERLRKRGSFSGSKLNSMPDPSDLADLAIWGAAKLAKGSVDFGKWSKEMVGEFGDLIKPHLDKLYAKSQKIYAGHIERTEHQLPNLKQLLKLYEQGKAGADWYAKTREELHKIFGRKDGDLMIRILASTSPNTTVPANVTLALKAFKQMKFGEDFHGELDSFGAFKPGYLPVVKNMLRAIRDGGDDDAIGGLKVQSFRKNLLGETDPVTIDRWMRRVFKFKSDNITDPQYKFMDYQVTQVARKLGVEPRQVQAAMWKAIRENEGETSSGAPFEELIRKRLEKDADLRRLIVRRRAAGSGR